MSTSTSQQQASPQKRPDRTTMEGMIWNANHVLDAALSPETNGIPRTLFQQCDGLILISVVEAGFIFTGNVGTGILLAKNNEKWSPPCALGLTGVGWGFVAGGSVKDLVVFLMSPSVVDTLACDNSIKIGGQVSATLGPLGRDGALDITLSGKGIGATVAFAFSSGIFGGVAVEGALVGARHAVNQAFYQKEVHPREILFRENGVQIPDGTLMPQVYRKLEMLAQGKTYTPNQQETQEVEQARQEAEKAGEEIKNSAAGKDIEYVDASVKAAQENVTASTGTNAGIPMDETPNNVSSAAAPS